jgi:hypothetical protein
MSPMMIESIAESELAERRERAARLRLRLQVRADSRREHRHAAPIASASRSIRSRLHLGTHPA